MEGGMRAGVAYPPTSRRAPGDTCSKQRGMRNSLSSMEMAMQRGAPCSWPPAQGRPLPPTPRSPAVASHGMALQRQQAEGKREREQQQNLQLRQGQVHVLGQLLVPLQGHLSGQGRTGQGKSVGNHTAQGLDTSWARLCSDTYLHASAVLVVYMPAAMQPAMIDPVFAMSHSGCRTQKHAYAPKLRENYILI